MVINVHAGHCPDGKGASGAVGIIKESTENRNVKNYVIEYLRNAGHTVYDCTCDESKDKTGCLQYIVGKDNEHSAALSLSIHFNDGVSDKDGNGEQTGTEIWAKDFSSIKGEIADAYLAGMKKLGFKSRGKKTSNSLYVLNKTNAKALLVEVCFVGDKDDTDLYKKVGASEVARVIAEAIHGEPIVTAEPTAEPEPEPIMVGDTVEVSSKTLKLLSTGNSKAVVVGSLDKGARLIIQNINSTGKKGKVAPNLWVALKYVKKV